MLVFIVAVFALLPFIFIDVTVQSNGLIRPLTDKNIITAPVSGRIRELFIEDNLPVKDDQTLIILESPILEEQIYTNQNRAVIVGRFIHDLQVLINETTRSAFSNVNSLQTSLYKQSYLHFQQQLSEANNVHRNVKKEFDRIKLLYEAKVIARVEYENIEFKHDQAVSDIDLLIKSQISKWQSDLNIHQQELTELEAEYRRLQKEKDRVCY